MPNYNTPNPPNGITETLAWCVYWIQFLKRRVNALASGGSGSGVNIYNSDGALSGNRTVDTNGKILTIGNPLDTVEMVLDNVAQTSTIGSTAGVQFHTAESTDKASMGDVGGAGMGTLLVVNDGAAFKSVQVFNALCTSTMQVYTGAGDVVMSLGTRGLYYDPTSLVTTAQITLPGAVDGLEIVILFGGTITGTAAPVVTTLNFALAAGQTRIYGTMPATATTNTAIMLKYRESKTAWYRKSS